MKEKLIDVIREWRVGLPVKKIHRTPTKNTPYRVYLYSVYRIYGGNTTKLVRLIKHYLIARGIGKEVVEKL